MPIFRPSISRKYNDHSGRGNSSAFLFLYDVLASPIIYKLKLF
nr:MAG TPA: hypothetical protein [Caudoviricetes sp.]